MSKEELSIEHKDYTYVREDFHKREKDEAVREERKKTTEEIREAFRELGFHRCGLTERGDSCSYVSPEQYEEIFKKILEGNGK